MSFKTKADMTVYNFLQHVPEMYHKNAKIMMYDTEPTAFGMGRTVPFDIGYRGFTINGGRGQSGGGLPYEVIRNRETMTHIQNYRKINEAVAGDLYYVIKLLRDEVNPANGEQGWFSTDVETAPLYGLKTREDVLRMFEAEINRQWGLGLPASVATAAGGSHFQLYQTFYDIYNVNRNSIAFFYNQKEQSPTTVKREHLAVNRGINLETVLNLYASHALTTQNLIDLLDQSDKGLADKVRYLRMENRKLIMQEERFAGIYDEKADMARLRSIPGGENVKPTREIMAEYEQAFKDGAVGIMGHNVRQDLQWTTNLLKMVPDSTQYSYLFDEGEINAFCSMNLMSRLYSMEGTALLQTMLSANAENLAGIFKEGADSLPGLVKKGMSLEVLCQNILDTKEAQEHTAVADVDLTIELFQKVAEDFVRGELSERK